MDQGADIHVPDWNGYTCLHWASWYGYLEIATCLIAKGASVNLVNGKQSTPLHHACDRNHLSVAELLIEYGADVNILEWDTRSSLHWALEHSHSDIARLLINSGADLDASDSQHSTPLHYAIEKDLIDIAVLLVENGVKVNAVNDEGCTALQSSFKMSSLDFLHLLMNKDATHMGKSPMQYYRENLHGTEKSMFQYLLKVNEKSIHDDYTRKAWFYFIDHHSNSSLTPSLRVEIITEFITSLPDHSRGDMVRCICTLQDENKRVALNLTDDNTKHLLQSYIYFCGRYEITAGPPVHQSATSVVVYAKDHYDIHQVKPVVIKFMMHKEQYEREVNQRQTLIDSESQEYVVGILLHSESEELRELWRNNKPVLDLAACHSHSQSGEGGAVKNLFDYKYGIVMEPGNRSLQAIFTAERPDPSFIRTIAKNILNCMQFMHSHNIMHGDIKMLNLVRFQDSKFRLVDLDASARLHQLRCHDDGNGTVTVTDGIYAGAKFSSACLPPEMIYKFETSEAIKMFRSYWRKDKTQQTDVDKDWLQKIEPKFSSKAHCYCIKAFLYDEDIRHQHQPSAHSSLPYELIEASYSIDIWSFGTLLYQLCSGGSLVQINVDDDFVSGDEMEYMYNWNEEKCQKKLNKVTDYFARDLLYKVLKPCNSPDERPSVTELLDHPFFRPDLDSHSQEGALILQGLEQLKKSQEDIKQRLEEQFQLTSIILQKTMNIEKISNSTQQALLKGVSEIKRYIKTTSDNTVPTVFIIRPVLEKKMIEKLMKEGSAISQSHANDSDSSISFFKKASQFYESIDQFSNSLQNCLDLDKTMFDMFNEEYEMALLCQLCYTSQETKVWPVKLSKRKESVEKMCKKILPIAKASIAVAKGVNGVAGIARMLGYPVPTIPVEYVEASMTYLSHPTSVSDYDRLEKRLMQVDKHTNAAADGKTLEGYSQREFQRYLEEVDEKHDWGELKCITLAEGYTMWCCQRCCDILETHAESSYEELREIVCVNTVTSSATTTTTTSVNQPTIKSKSVIAQTNSINNSGNNNSYQVSAGSFALVTPPKCNVQTSSATVEVNELNYDCYETDSMHTTPPHPHSTARGSSSINNSNSHSTLPNHNHSHNHSRTADSGLTTVDEEGFKRKMMDMQEKMLDMQQQMFEMQRQMLKHMNTNSSSSGDGSGSAMNSTSASATAAKPRQRAFSPFRGFLPTIHRTLPSTSPAISNTTTNNNNITTNKDTASTNSPLRPPSSPQTTAAGSSSSLPSQPLLPAIGGIATNVSMCSTQAR